MENREQVVKARKKFPMMGGRAWGKARTEAAGLQLKKEGINKAAKQGLWEAGVEARERNPKPRDHFGRAGVFLYSRREGDHRAHAGAREEPGGGNTQYGLCPVEELSLED